MLVSFYTASWCKACKGMKPNVISACNDSNVEYAELDVDKHTDLAISLDVITLPTVIIFDNGKELDRIVGTASKYEVMKRIAQAGKE